jgi:undecaprenyl-diphosphatase
MIRRASYLGEASATLAVFRVITHLGGVTATVVPGVVLLLMGGHEQQIGLAILLANAISHVGVQSLKRLVARPRPADLTGQPLATIALPDPFSFPSGHAAAATAVGVTAAWAYPTLAPVFVTAAAAVAVSRVVLRVHYWSDVVAGIVLGLLGAGAAVQIIT